MIDPVLKAASRLHGYAIFKTFLERSQWWSPDQRDAWVTQQLKATLVSALAVPFYRDRFAALGFDPRLDVRSTDDLAKLPILTRDEVRAHHAELCAPSPRATYTTAHTSGTTGEPLAMRLSESFLAFDAACVFRHWSWAGYGFRAPIVALRSFVPEPGEELWRYSRAQNTLFCSAYHLTPHNCERYIDRVLAFRPQIIRAYPSTMTVFAEYAYRRRAEFSFVRGIFTSSETLLDHERDIIERTFGNKVFNWYGMTEPALVLTECAHRRGMHVNWEYGHGELVRSDELGPDEYRLVTTGFHNPAMPFIRYDTGDIVRVHGTDRRCECGRTMPLLHSVAGRKDECILTPDGRRLPSVNFYTMFRKYAAVLRFQLAQYGHREVVVRIAPRAHATLPAEVLAAIRNELAARLGPAVAIELEVTHRFITNADGKSPAIVRRPGTRAVEEHTAYAISTQTAWAQRAKGRDVHKLDWNEADRVPSPRVRDALVALLDRDESICWYPEAESRELVTRIASYAGVSPHDVLLVAGSDAGIELVASALVQRGDAVLLVTPTYDNCRAILEHRGARIVTFAYDGQAPLDLDAFEQVMRRSAARAVYLCNPNNPLGYVLDEQLLAHLEGMCRRLGSILVVDEAYFELCGITAASHVREPDSSVIVLRTFSKAFGLAGLRIGYVLAAGAVMRTLRKIHNPKSVTTFAKVAAHAALSDLGAVRAYVDEVAHGRERVRELLVANGVRTWPSAGNFLLFEWPRAGELIAYFEARRILVRDRSAQLARPSIRVTIGSARSVDALLAALASYFASSRAGS